MGYRYQCPHCRNVIVVQFCQPGDKAICKSCFMPAEVPLDAHVTSGKADDARKVCVNHLDKTAPYTCSSCSVAICEECIARTDDFLTLCPDCASTHSPAASINTTTQSVSIPEGAKCASHPEIAATALCSSCGLFICATCDFMFPGNLHFCPQCVSRPPESLEGKRKTLVIWSYVFAAIGTLSLIFTFGGLSTGLLDESSQALTGAIFVLLVMAPGVAGFAQAMSAHDKRLHNPSIIVGAIVWNSILIATYVLLSIVGSFE